MASRVRLDAIIDADTSGLIKKVDAAQLKLDKFASKKYDAALTLNVAKVTADIGKVKAKLDEFTAKKYSPKVALDTTEFDKKLVLVKAKLADLNKRFQVTIGLNDSEMGRKIDNMKRRLSQISSTSSILTLNTSDCNRRIDEIKRRLASLGGNTSSILLDTKDFDLKIDKIKQKLESIGSGSTSVLLDTKEFERKIQDVKTKLSGVGAGSATLDLNITKFTAQLNKAGTQLDKFATKSANIKITADFTDVIRKIDAVKAKIDGLKTLSANIKVTADTSEVTRKLADVSALIDRVSIKSASIKVTADTSQVTVKLDAVIARMDRLQGKSANIVVTADTSNALRKMDDVIAKVNDLKTRSANIKITADTSDVTRKITDVLTMVRTLNRYSITITADITEAKAKIMELKAMLRELSGYKITIGADTAGARAEIDRLKARLDTIRDRTVRVRVNTNRSEVDSFTSSLGGGGGAGGSSGGGLMGALQRIAVLAGRNPLAALGATAAAAGGQFLSLTQGVLSAAQSIGTMLPSAISVAMQAFGGIKLAFSGVSGALSAYDSQQKSTAKSATTASNQMAGATAAVTNAQNQLTTAQNTSSASIQKANAAVESSQKSLTAAQDAGAASAQKADYAVEKAQAHLTAVQNAGASSAEKANYAVEKAQRNLTAAQNAGTVAVQKATAIAVAAASSLTIAQDAVTKAVDTTRNAQNSYESSLLSLTSAQDTYKVSTMAVTAAQQTLNTARQTAIQTLKDLNTQTIRGSLDQRGAILNLQQAQLDLNTTMADPKATGLMKAQALLRRDIANQDLKDTLDKVAKDKAAAAVTIKAGIEGDKAVIAAKTGVTKANISAEKAANSLNKATFASSNSANNLEKAQISQKDATIKLAMAQAKAGQAQAGIAAVSVSSNSKVAAAQAALTKAQKGTAGSTDRIAAAQAALTQAQKNAASSQVGSTDKIAAAQAALAQAQKNSASSQVASKNKIGAAQDKLTQSQAAAASVQTAADARIKSAQDKLSQAQERLGKISAVAGNQAAGAFNAFDYAMSKLPPATQNFVRELIKMKKEIQPLHAASAVMFTGMIDGLHSVMTNMPVLVTGFKQTGLAIGDVARQAGKALSGPLFRKDLSKLMADNATIIHNVGLALVALIRPFMDLAVVGSHIFAAFSPQLIMWAKHLAIYVQAKRQSGELAKTLEQQFHNLQSFGKIIWSFFSIVNSVLKAARTASGDTLGTFADWLKKIAAAAKDVNGQNKMVKFFQDLNSAGSFVWHTIESIARVLKDFFVGLTGGTSTVHSFSAELRKMGDSFNSWSSSKKTRDEILNFGKSTRDTFAPAFKEIDAAIKTILLPALVSGGNGVHTLSGIFGIFATLLKGIDWTSVATAIVKVGTSFQSLTPYLNIATTAINMVIDTFNLIPGAGTVVAGVLTVLALTKIPLLGNAVKWLGRVFLVVFKTDMVKGWASAIIALLGRVGGAFVGLALRIPLVGAAIRAIALIGMGPFAVIGAAIAALVGTIMWMNSVTKKGKDEIKGFTDSLPNKNVNDLTISLDKMVKKQTEVNTQIDHTSDLHVSARIKLLAESKAIYDHIASQNVLINTYRAVATQFGVTDDAAKAIVVTLGVNVKDGAKQMSDEFLHGMTNLNKISAAFGVTRLQALELSKTLGIDLKGNYAIVSQEIYNAQHNIALIGKDFNLTRDDAIALGKALGYDLTDNVLKMKGVLQIITDPLISLGKLLGVGPTQAAEYGKALGIVFAADVMLAAQQVKTLTTNVGTLVAGTGLSATAIGGFSKLFKINLIDPLANSKDVYDKFNKQMGDVIAPLGLTGDMIEATGKKMLTASGQVDAMTASLQALKDKATTTSTLDDIAIALDQTTINAQKYTDTQGQVNMTLDKSTDAGHRNIKSVHDNISGVTDAISSLQQSEIATKGQMQADKDAVTAKQQYTKTLYDHLIAAGYDQKSLVDIFHQMGYNIDATGQLSKALQTTPTSSFDAATNSAQKLGSGADGTKAKSKQLNQELGNVPTDPYKKASDSAAATDKAAKYAADHGISQVKGAFDNIGKLNFGDNTLTQLGKIDAGATVAKDQGVRPLWGALNNISKLVFPVLLHDIRQILINANGARGDGNQGVGGLNKALSTVKDFKLPGILKDLHQLLSDANGARGDDKQGVKSIIASLKTLNSTKLDTQQTALKQILSNSNSARGDDRQGVKSIIASLKAVNTTRLDTQQAALKQILSNANSARGDDRQGVKSIQKALNDVRVITFPTLLHDIRQILINANGARGDYKDSGQGVNAVRWSLDHIVKKVPSKIEITGTATYGDLKAALQKAAGASWDAIKGFLGFEDGGLLTTFAEGGKLPSHATIKSPQKHLVQWAEPSTGGEAFIPLHPSKRARSTEIWKETGKRLGAKSFAEGGILSTAAEAKGVKTAINKDAPQKDIKGAGAELQNAMISTVKVLVQAANDAKAATDAATSGDAGWDVARNITTDKGKIAAIIAAARSQLGVPYSWGGGGPGGPSRGIDSGANTVGFDCSGLMEYSFYKGAKIEIGGVTTTQENAGKAVDPSKAIAGDIVFLGPKGATHHVALVSGANKIIQAPQPGKNVEEVSTSFVSGGSGGGGPGNLKGLEDLWTGAGGPGGEVAHIAAAIGMAESGGKGIKQQGQPYGTTGWGIWQITPGNALPQFGTDDQLFNGHRNAQAAVFDYKGRGFQPWTTYTSGAYKKFMEEGGFNGIQSFDSGGILKPGYTLAHNGTGSPEAVTAMADGGIYSPAGIYADNNGKLKRSVKTFFTGVADVNNRWNWYTGGSIDPNPTSADIAKVDKAHAAYDKAHSPKSTVAKNKAANTVTTTITTHSVIPAKVATHAKVVTPATKTVAKAAAPSAVPVKVVAHGIPSGSTTQIEKDKSTIGILSSSIANDTNKIQYLLNTNASKASINQVKANRTRASEDLKRWQTYLAKDVATKKSLDTRAAVAKKALDAHHDNTMRTAVGKTNAGGRGVPATPEAATYLVDNAATNARFNPLERVVDTAVRDVAVHGLTNVMKNLDPIAKVNKPLYFAIKKKIYDNFASFIKGVTAKAVTDAATSAVDDTTIAADAIAAADAASTDAASTDTTTTTTTNTTAISAATAAQIVAAQANLASALAYTPGDRLSQTSYSGATYGLGPTKKSLVGMAKGGRLAGYGGGDIIPAMLEPGETIVQKELSSKVAAYLSKRSYPGKDDVYSTGTVQHNTGGINKAATGNNDDGRYHTNRTQAPSENRVDSLTADKIDVLTDIMKKHPTAVGIEVANALNNVARVAARRRG
jgi:cell wall-associated NlpC family hydrolase